MSSQTDQDEQTHSNKEYQAIQFSLTIWLIVAMVYITFISLAITYEEEKQKRFEFLVKYKISFESKLVQDILSMLVPKFVKTSIQEGTSILDRFILLSLFPLKRAEHRSFSQKHTVSILFCDISNFDEVISNEQENVVQILDRLYRHFDDLCFSFGVQKIEVPSLFRNYSSSS